MTSIVNGNKNKDSQIDKINENIEELRNQNKRLKKQLDDLYEKFRELKGQIQTSVPTQGVKTNKSFSTQGVKTNKSFSTQGVKTNKSSLTKTNAWTKSPVLTLAKGVKTNKSFSAQAQAQAQARAKTDSPVQKSKRYRFSTKLPPYQSDSHTKNLDYRDFRSVGNKLESIPYSIIDDDKSGIEKILKDLIMSACGELPIYLFTKGKTPYDKKVNAFVNIKNPNVYMAYYPKLKNVSLVRGDTNFIELLNFLNKEGGKDVFTKASRVVDFIVNSYDR